MRVSVVMAWLALRCAFDDSGANPMMMMTHSRSGGSPADVTTSENLGVLIMSSRRRASNALQTAWPPTEQQRQAWTEQGAGQAAACVYLKQ